MPSEPDRVGDYTSLERLGAVNLWTAEGEAADKHETQLEVRALAALPDGLLLFARGVLLRFVLERTARER